MLKITIHDSASELKFGLEGRLSGLWVGELRQCWLTAASTTQGRTTVLDLREVDFVDPDGQSLLAEMGHAGVKMMATTPLIRALVDEFSPGSGYSSVEGKPASRPHAILRRRTSGRHPRTV